MTITMVDYISKRLWAKNRVFGFKENTGTHRQRHDSQLYDSYCPTLKYGT